MKLPIIETQKQVNALPTGKAAPVDNGGLIGLRVKKDVYRGQPRAVYEVKPANSKRWQRLGKPGVTTLDEARAMHAAFIQAEKAGRDGDRAVFALTASTDQIVAEWMCAKYGDAAGSWEHAAGPLRSWQIHWSPVIGGTVFRDLKYHDVLAAYEKLMTAPKKNISAIRSGFVWLNNAALRAFGQYRISQRDQGEEPIRLPKSAAEAGNALDVGKPPKQEKRQTRLNTVEQFRALYHALPQDNAGTVLRLLLLTGARKMEIADMEWQELGPDKWVIPEGTRTKTGAAKFVPLLPPWTALLPPRPADAAPGQKVFETSGHWSLVNGEWRYISTGILPSRINYVLAKVVKQLQAGDPTFPLLTVHDLRRSFSSLAAGDTGAHINLAVADQMIGHKPPHNGIGQQGVYFVNIHDRSILEGWAQWSEWLVKTL